MKKVIAIFSFVFCCFVASAQETSTFTDTRDGKVYKMVKIGNQWWMAENLAYKVPDYPNFLPYDFHEYNVAIYGYLYDWTAASKAVPAGWHLPSVEEWATLISYLGGQDLAGCKLKSNTNWDGSNQSAFCALPGGKKDQHASFNSLGKVAVFWTSFYEYDDNEDEWARLLSVSSDTCRIEKILKSAGDYASVRLIKN